MTIIAFSSLDHILRFIPLGFLSSGLTIAYTALQLKRGAFHDRTLIKASLSYLAQRVGRSLREEGKQARTVTLKLRYSDFTTVTRQKTLKATSSDQPISDAGLELLEKILLYVKQPIRLVGIGVSNLVEPATQLDMLDPKVMARERLSRQIDRIRQKYGFHAILPGRTLPLKYFFPRHDDGFPLHTPGLSR